MIVASDGKGLKPCVEPHKPPNMLNAYMTRYDYDYNRGEISPITPRPEDRESGHSRNRPLFGHPPGLDWKSTTHHDYDGKRGVSLPSRGDMGLIAAEAAQSRILNTAHIRGLKSMAGVPWNEDPTISTYKDHYPKKWSTPSGGGAAYAGSKATQFNPDFLRIDAPDDDGVGKAKKPKGWRPEDRPITAPLVVRKGDNLSVFGPDNGDRQFSTEYSTYGNKDLYKKSLLPTHLKSLPGDRSNPDKRGLLDELAGRRRKGDGIYGSMFDTNPIPMSLDEMDKCRVAKRHELEGPVNMTIYQSDYIRRMNMPEMQDPPKDNGQGILNLTNKELRLPPRPMHPSKKRCEEKREMRGVQDRHMHKLHPIPRPPTEFLNSHGSEIKPVTI